MQQTVVFNKIDLASSVIEELILEESWWLQLKQFCNGILVLSSFEEDKPMETKGVQLINWENQEEYFQFPDFNFLGRNNNLFFFQNQEGACYEFSFIDKHLKEVDDFSLQENESIIQRPFSYQKDDEYFNELSLLIEKKTKHKAQAMIEYMELKQSIIISYYIYNAELLTNYLLVMTLKGEVIYHQEIGKELKGVGVETFFTCDEKIFTIKEKSELVVLAI